METFEKLSNDELSVIAGFNCAFAPCNKRLYDLLKHNYILHLCECTARKRLQGICNCARLKNADRVAQDALSGRCLLSVCGQTQGSVYVLFSAQTSEGRHTRVAFFSGPGSRDYPPMKYLWEVREWTVTNISAGISSMLNCSQQLHTNLARNVEIAFQLQINLSVCLETSKTFNRRL